MGHPVVSAATSAEREQQLVALVRRAAVGDQGALAALYDETSSLVYGLAVRILRDQFAAEDVTIEVYAQAYRESGLYDATRGTPSAWLVMLARSRAIDRLRTESRRRTREEPLDAAPPVPSVTAGPEEWSLGAERRHAVRTALAALNPEQRQVIEIAYYEGLSHTEIAAKLGQPVGTVKTRIRTGMMRLRELLRPLCQDELP